MRTIPITWSSQFIDLWLIISVAITQEVPLDVATEKTSSDGIELGISIVGGGTLDEVRND